MAGELINMDGLGNALIYIADKLGITVMQMYEIYYRAQMTMALIQIVMIVLCITTLLGVGLIVYLCVRKDEKMGDEDKVLISIVVGGLAAVIMIFICAALYYPLIAYFCPDYTALKSLMYDMGDMISLVRK